MQAFLASDVVYSQRVAPLIKDGARQERRQGPADRRQPLHAGHLVAGAGHRGLAPGPQREQRLVRHVRASRRPACTATGSLSTSVGAVTLQPEAPGVVNRVPWSNNPTLTVKFANQGDNDESNVKVSVSVKPTTGKTIAATKTIGQTKASQTATVNIPLGAAPPANAPTTVTVAIAKVPGEKTIDNNRSSYTVIFTR